MEFNEFKVKFVDQLIGEDEAAIKIETEFRQLSSWDSLTAMAIIAMIDDEYGVKLTNDELKDLKTVGDVYNFVAARK